MNWKLIAVAAAVQTLLAGPMAVAQQSITVLSGGTSGAYYPFGVAIAKIYSDKIAYVQTRVQATEGSVENLMLLQNGRGEIAFSLGDTLKAAWDGDTDAGFKSKTDKLRVIGAIYPNYIQIVVATRSGIKTLGDLKGKRFSVGARGSGTELSARAVLGAAGLGFGDLAQVDFLPFGESINRMTNGQLDATLESAGLGVASLKDLTSASGFAFVAIPAETVKSIGPPFAPATIPANTYQGQDRDVPTAAVANYLVTSSAVSDDLAYQMTKLVFESLPELANAQRAGRDIRLDTAAATPPAPLHPGAIRYYKEKGVLK